MLLQPASGAKLFTLPARRRRKTMGVTCGCDPIVSVTLHLELKAMEKGTTGRNTGIVGMNAHPDR
jgi:hypothetical protein